MVVNANKLRGCGELLEMIVASCWKRKPDCRARVTQR